MNQYANHTRWIVSQAVRIIVCSIVISILSCSYVLAQVPPSAELKSKLVRADKMFQLQRWDLAANLANQIMSSSDFDSVDVAFKTDVHLLLARSLFFLGKREQAKETLGKIVESNPSFDLANAVVEEELKAMVKELLAVGKSPEKPRPVAFEFVSVPAKVSAKIGSTRHQQIRVRPSSANVAFTLENPRANLFLTQIDSVTAELTFTPDPSEVDSTRTAMITASNSSLSKRIAISLEVSRRGGGIGKYLIGAGAVAAAGAGVIIWCPWCPDPPLPPPTGLPEPPGPPNGR